MDFQDVVARRRMIRNFQDGPVEPATVDRMLHNAVRAPNAGFSQGWAFLVLDDRDDVARFWEATSPDPDADSSWLAGMRRAPVIIVPLANKDAYLDRYAQPDKGWTDRDEARWPAPYWDIDTGMAALLILQTAVDEGLGACLFGIPPDRIDAFRTAFEVPPAYRPIGAIAVGHPAEGGASGSPTRRARRPLDEVVHHARFQPTTPPEPTEP
ncbi:nitroreductase family protein [Solicola gregarius]|uniref:Nitroreductase family protein n=1 Tax=Solicola gregarius TaxID=2908642 RepID=A0AA46TKN1_9ACTN|nr:nitroreductase family protein [Solicola gregarius]UYM07074.1 nitroreductase family protein [Solicola gregarius]